MGMGSCVMMGWSRVGKLAWFILAFVVFGYPQSEMVVVEGAITCKQVQAAIRPCESYLKGEGGSSPAGNCCNGVRSLKNMANRPPNISLVCRCLTQQAAGIKGLRLDRMQSLPTKCGVALPRNISIRRNPRCN